MKVFVVNAFAENGFFGNPAGVCFVDCFPPDGEMRKTAAKAGFSETAFVQQCGDDFFIRWWTPKVEVALCGHATLAAAYLIFQKGEHGKPVRFVSGTHTLSAEKHAGMIWMDFPADTETRCAKPENIAGILGIKVVYTGKNSSDYLVEVENESDVASLRPDLKKAALLDCRGIIVTSASHRNGCDFVSRFFAPRAGIDEDPVTGSAHTCLAGYWGKKLGKEKMTGLQVSRRGGVVHVEVAGNRVKIGGCAVADGVLVL